MAQDISFIDSCVQSDYEYSIVRYSVYQGRSSHRDNNEANTFFLSRLYTYPIRSFYFTTNLSDTLYCNLNTLYCNLKLSGCLELQNTVKWTIKCLRRWNYRLLDEHFSVLLASCFANLQWKSDLGDWTTFIFLTCNI